MVVRGIPRCYPDWIFLLIRASRFNPLPRLRLDRVIRHVSPFRADFSSSVLFCSSWDFWAPAMDSETRRDFG